MLEIGKKEIGQVDVLVYPYAYSSGNTALVETPAYRQLAEIWDHREKVVATRDDALMVRVSHLGLAILQLGLVPFKDAAVKQELDKIKVSKERLGERLIVFNGDIPQLRDDFLGNLTHNKLSWKPGEIRVFAYGEDSRDQKVYGQIETWAKIVGDYFGAGNQDIVVDTDCWSMSRHRQRKIEAQYREAAWLRSIVSSPIMFGGAIY